MIYACQICGKGKDVGHNVSYSKRRTRRVFLPNLSWVDLSLNGQVGKMRICMKCLKKMKKEGKVFQKAQREKKTEKIEPTN